MSKRFSTNMSQSATKAVALLLIVGMGLSVVLAGAVSFYASGSPDGLESVAEEQQFADQGQDSATSDSPFADYGVSGLEQERVSVGIAGLVGVAVTAVVAFLLFTWLRRRPSQVGADARPGASPDAAGPVDTDSSEENLG